MKFELDHVQVFQDRHGKWRYYFRKPGHKRRALPGNPKSKATQPGDFYAAYQEALSEAGTIKPGESRAVKAGSVPWLVAEFYASPSFLGRPASAQAKLRRHCDDLACEHSNRAVAKLDEDVIERMFWKRKETPAAANQWLDAVRDLLTFAVKKKKLMAINPAAEIKKMKGKPGGHHTWTEAEMEQFRARWPVGSKERLALELHHTFALRRSDAIRLGPGHLRDGMLTYTQFKNRERNPVEVVVPMPPGLKAIITATSVTGTSTWLVTGNGTPFNVDYYGEWFAKAVKEAGLPDECTSHGIRKRGCADLAEAGVTTKEGAAVSGHRTTKEWERYTEKADRRRLATAAMEKAAEQRQSATRR